MPNCRICSADESFQSIRSPHVFGGREEHNFWQCDLSFPNIIPRRRNKLPIRKAGDLFGIYADIGKMKTIIGIAEPKSLTLGLTEMNNWLLNQI